MYLTQTNINQKYFNRSIAKGYKKTVKKVAFYENEDKFIKPNPTHSHN